jgi:hypothetical protein
MDARHNALMAEMARDAGIERSDFLVRAGEQLERFMSANRGRIRELGGIVLIDDDPDYLAVAVDGTFRSRARVYDDAKAEWVTETEVIETAAELVELYNPADVLQAFADASADDTGLTDSSLLEVDPTAEIEPSVNGADPYAGAADSWAAGQPDVPEAHDADSAAEALYDLALDFQERSQRTEAGLLEQFERASSGLMGQLGSVVIVDDEDEHLTIGVGGFRGKVVPEGLSGWEELAGPDAIVRYYDPTDVFGDLAEAIADAYPHVAADPEADTGDAGEADAGEAGNGAEALAEGADVDGDGETSGLN